MSKLKNFIYIVSAILVLLGIILFSLAYFLEIKIVLPLITYIISVIIIATTFFIINKWRKDADHYSSVQLNSSISDAIDLASVGIIVYNENYEVTWLSELFKERSIDVSGKKVLSWIPDLNDLISGSVERITIVLDNYKYEVTKKDDASVLFFRDITEVYDLKKKASEDAVVFGLINFDNLDEIARSDEEITTISNDLHLLVLEYLKDYGVTYKTLRNHRIYLILNEKIYQKLADDRFSILNIVRKAAKRMEVPVTLSIALARGNNDLKGLDEMAASLLELAQTRGGDQVAVRKDGEDVIFYGGTSEAKEKSSKVQVRVMTNTIKDLIIRSSNVIIACHTDADADCVGAALAMANIAKSFKKETYVILKSGGIESRVADILNNNKEIFDERHLIVSANEAQNHLGDDSLVIMVDHHSAAISNAKQLLSLAKRIIIIDHHRRMADFDTSPILTYIEPAASSTCEIVSEFIPYLMGRVSITQLEANIMYLGILIDTNRFRTRTGVRTFEALKVLRQFGADPSVVERYNEEPYEMIKKRSNLINTSKEYISGIIISKGNNEIYSRSIISQAGDTLLQTIGIKAVFVLAYINENEVAISARSKGEFNVQVVMEKMNGGGHKTSAGLQVKDKDIDELEKELLSSIEEYIKGDLL